MRQNSLWNKEKVRKIRVHKKIGCAIDEVVWQIEEEIIGLKGGYLFWGVMEQRSRERLGRRIKEIIRAGLLTRAFKEALRKDILGNDGIPEFRLHITQHILKDWYAGRILTMMKDLGEKGDE